MSNNFEKAVEKFYGIRNLPYHIATKGEKGCDCEDKGNMLIAELKVLGINARPRVGLFYWSDLDLPSGVTTVDHDNDCSHLFIEVENNRGEWVFVDPTWNPELVEAGLPIAEWDGEHSTKLAIDCYEIFSPEDTRKYLAKINYESDLIKNSKFYEAINQWCDSYLKK